MQYSMKSTIGEIVTTEKGRQILGKHVLLNQLLQNHVMAQRKTLQQTVAEPMFGMTEKKAELILADLNRPITEIMPEVFFRKSLDEIDRESFHAGKTPFDGACETIILSQSSFANSVTEKIISLDGVWQLAENGEESKRLNAEWSDAIPASVPGSVHTALVEAGVIPDPTIGKNQIIAREESLKTWWMKKTFAVPEKLGNSRIIFGGVCNRASFWLNGNLLGRHEGMFGGPEMDISGRLCGENTLIVKLEPIPFCPAPDATMPDTTSNPTNNESWQDTVVFNNVYGWHYSNLPSLGIWRSVAIKPVPDIEIPDPYITTIDAVNGVMRLSVSFRKNGAVEKGVLKGVIYPDNFVGCSFCFEKKIKLHADEQTQVFKFAVPDPKLWWPNDLGEQNLYKLELAIVPESGTGEKQSILFGIRTVTMEPLPEGPNENKYKWTFVINETPCFVKGTGWCTMDPLMDFSREKYERLILLAHQQHIQMMRAWGSGMPETNDFYDLCSRYGIMVIQEWPTAWDSHLRQPYAVIEETVRINTLRLRNYPSLVMWGAGNESPNPFGTVIDMMGKTSIELDGTRPFHRGEPWGGSSHNYECYWGREHFDFNVTLTSDFFGEFGLASVPDYESLIRYLPEEELDSPPPYAKKVFTYHTPIFGTADDVSRLAQYAGYFLPETYDMKQFIRASQLAQATGIRHTLERARVRWPDCAGALYYKMNDNFPAASWACVDWYGTPKLGHYVFQDAFSPLHACVLSKTLNTRGTPAKFDVCLLDDADCLKDSEWKVKVTAYGKNLQEIKTVLFQNEGSIKTPSELGMLELSCLQTDTCPLFITTEVIKNQVLTDRTFYWYNFEGEKGCLFSLPKTRISFEVEQGAVTVRNLGDFPAVGVEISRPGHLHTFTVSDNYFWLNPGEKITVEVNETDGISVCAWNMPGCL